MLVRSGWLWDGCHGIWFGFSLWVWYAIVFMSLVCEGLWVVFVVHSNRLNFIILCDLFYLIVCVKLWMCFHYFQLPIYWYQSTKASALMFGNEMRGYSEEEEKGRIDIPLLVNFVWLFKNLPTTKDNRYLSPFFSCNLFFFFLRNILFL